MILHKDFNSDSSVTQTTGYSGAQSLNRLEITFLTLDLSTVLVSLTISELH